ncbi:MAG TPA: TetR/AcrR family transcriptional regulator [Solirubrobacteraceae bacterium]|nr:TetR/AcrR family transcriptional regulator [Solirubrobacteraceae bacterium]
MSPRVYSQVARAEGEERTRTALLDAATRTFFEEDWTGTSLEAIAAEAGVTKQTLLRHFGSRDGLARAAFERAKGAVVAQRAAAPAGDVEGAVENLLDHYEAFGDRALKLEALPPGAPGHEFVQEGRKLHYEWVEAVFEPLLGWAKGSERKRRRAALIAICDVHTWRLLSRHLGQSRHEVKATLIAAIDGVLARPA